MCQISANEVNHIYYKRNVLFLLPTIVLSLLLLTPPAQAATSSSKVGAVAITSGALNVRSGPSTGSAVVASLGKGSAVTLLSQSGAWWQVEYAKGKFGYCHGDYITVGQGTPVSVAISSGSLNVRSGPGTSYSRVGSLSKGEVVLQLSTSNGWAKVLYHGTKTGYVSTQYLSGTRGSISLAVPSFKQTDSRWADKLVGESGKTFAKIGCATTAIAMMESYRTGTTIYPDAMAQQLRYTSSGSVYWPSHFTAVTSSADYLSAIYSKLQQGKPVLFGAKNAAGSQHWVVVTGYQGGDELTAAGFSILDPGSHSRTNLQQLLNVYPTFYKYFYY